MFIFLPVLFFLLLFILLLLDYLLCFYKDTYVFVNLIDKISPHLLVMQMRACLLFIYVLFGGWFSIREFVPMPDYWSVCFR